MIDEKWKRLADLGKPTLQTIDDPHCVGVCD
jgi:hypothetical protein